MAVFFQCGFLRSCLLHANVRFHSKDTCGKYSYFQEQFHDYINIEQKHFNRKLMDFTAFINKKKWRGAKREKYVELFSRKVWNILSNTERKKHTLNNCVECLLKYQDSIELFPPVTGHRIKGKNKRKIALKDITNTPTQSICNTPLAIETEENIPVKENITNSTPSPNSVTFQSKIPVTEKSLAYMKASAQSVLKDINKQWDKVYETPFTKVLTKIPECNIVKKSSSSEKKKHLRQIHRKVKRSIEKSWEEKDTDTFYGTRQSKSRYCKQRTSLFFEKRSETIKRHDSNTSKFNC